MRHHAKPRHRNGNAAPEPAVTAAAALFSSGGATLHAGRIVLGFVDLVVFI
jgi:hypothetical protein